MLASLLLLLTLHAPASTAHIPVPCVASDGTLLTATLHGGGVRLAAESGRVTWDAFDLALKPWLLRAGYFAGQDVLLVGVRKTTIFDPVERTRPFIYSIKPGGLGLRKVWLGTSLSRPFISADFGDLDSQGEDELVALERTQSGGLALGAYRWEGFGVEGIARSEEIPGAREVLCGDVLSGGGEEAVVLCLHGDQWRFLVYRLSPGVLVLAAEARATVGPGPAAWAIHPSPPGPSAITITRGPLTRPIRLNQTP